MKYFSTRGGEIELSFEETVLTGLAPNGGLYIPAEIPLLPEDWEEKWSSYTFQQLSVAVLSLYISPSEISTQELSDLVEKSYKTFRHTDVTPLKRLDGSLGERHILELWHGPTYAFKDVALQLLGNIFEFFLQRQNAKKGAGEQRERLTVLGATSGDTGSAAIYGLRNKADIAIYILHPKGRVSPIQEAQMTTVTDSNVHNIAVKGTFDDCQASSLAFDIVKTLFSDQAFNAQHHLGAINSINWARILAQTVYYFLAYFSLRRTMGVPLIQFVVPTGNFGDVLAGYYAKRMGLPVENFVIATNENDILARFWKSGKYEKISSDVGPEETVPADGASDGKQAGGVKETLSPAMDILISSNFERLLWYLAYEDAANDRQIACATVNGWMDKMKSDGRVSVPVSVLEAARKDFVAERISDSQTLQSIRDTFDESKYVADPHTAVGIAAAKVVAGHRWAKDKGPSQEVVQIILSTAHPAKFSEAVTTALHDAAAFSFEKDVLPDDFKGLLKMERRVIDVENSVDAVKKVINDRAP
ncbi:tryptophan synthase beta subunit-like PLP-dependent enzyme [Hysterangium stoloniferum]|nr:tryptophan synthase beta subunit-like PLP-dependent enzyme [Hysterangium stoloniferum]